MKSKKYASNGEYTGDTAQNVSHSERISRIYWSYVSWKVLLYDFFYSKGGLRARNIHFTRTLQALQAHTEHWTRRDHYGVCSVRGAAVRAAMSTLPTWKDKRI